jgi:hypothetical protein
MKGEGEKTNAPAHVIINPITCGYCGIRFDRLAPTPAKIICPNAKCKILIGEYDGKTVIIYPVRKPKN